MKTKFKAYYHKRAKHELQDMFGNAIICPDTNVLLNLFFNLDHDSADKWLEILAGLQDQLWMPHQVAFEYHHNVERLMSARLKAVHDVVLNLFQEPFPEPISPVSDEIIASAQAKLEDYKAISAKDVQEIVNLKRHLLQTTFESRQKLIENIKAAQEEARLKVTAIVSNWKDSYVERYKKTKSKIADLFDGRVGPAYEPEELSKKCALAKDRYLQRVPPGYADKKKEQEHGNPYGDAIIWFQMLDRAQIDPLTPMIFVTADRTKEDWFYEDFEEKAVAPRAELVAEMKQRANCEFHLYRADIFLRAASDHLNRSVPEALVTQTEKSLRPLSPSMSEIVEQLRNSTSLKDSRMTKLFDDIASKQEADNAKLKKMFDEINDQFLKPFDELERQVHKPFDELEAQVHKPLKDILGE